MISWISRSQGHAETNHLATATIGLPVPNLRARILWPVLCQSIIRREPLRYAAICASKRVGIEGGFYSKIEQGNKSGQ